MALKSFSSALALSAFSLAAPNIVLAQTWDGQTNTNWSTGTNWNNDLVPGVGDTVTINNGALANQPTVDTNQTVAQTNVSAGTLTVDAILTSPVTVSGTGAVLLNTGGAINGNVSTSGMITVDGGNITGVVRLAGGTLAATGDTTISGSINFVGGGGATISAASGTTLTIGSLNPVNSFFDPTAHITIGSTGQTGTVVAVDSFAAISTAQVAVEGGVLRIGGGSAGLHLLDFIAGTSIASGATLDIGGYATTVNSLSGSGTVTNSGSSATLRLVGTSTFGGVIQDGAGITSLSINSFLDTVTLSGANTYTGPTTVNFGTLELKGGSAIVDTGAVVLANNATLDIDDAETIGSISGTILSNVHLDATLTTGANDTTTTFSGVISGTGGLTKTGTGTFTLSGTNTYSGLTTVSGGILRIMSSNALGTAAGQTVVESGAVLALDGPPLFPGTLAVTEAITLNGTGIDNEGALHNVGGPATILGQITLASASRINNDSALALDGQIAGPGQDLTVGGTGNTYINGGLNTVDGALFKDGSGLLVLGVSGSFGATTVNDGILAVQGGGLSDTALLTVNAPGLVTFISSDTLGNIAGDGVIRSGAFSSTTLTVGNDDDSVFAGEIGEDSFAVSFTKQGTGTLTLAGNSTYTGPTTINSGALKVNGSITSDVTVNNLGTLMGTGSVGAVTVNSGGTLAPGASIESLVINGDLTLLAGSFTDIEVDPASTAADLIDVSGTASLAGTLRHIGTDGAYRAFSTYRILEAISVQGTFDAVQSSYLFLTPEVQYGANYVDMTLIRNDISLASEAQSSNQAAVANAIDGTISNLPAADPAYQDLVNQLVSITDPTSFRNSLNQLSGAEYAQHLQSVLWSTRAVTRVITERMECAEGASPNLPAGAAAIDGASVIPTADAPMAATGCFEAGRLSLWSRGFGSWNSLQGDNNAPGYDETQYGILFGADYSFDEAWFLGVAGGYFNSNGDFDNWGGRSGASIDYDGLQLAAYGGYDDGAAYVRGTLAFGAYDGDAKRAIVGPGPIAGLLDGNPSSDVLSFYGEGGYRFAIGSVSHLTPFAGLWLAGAELDGFKEDDPEGTGAALKVKNSDADWTASVLGLRYNAVIETSAGALVPELSLAWSHSFGDARQDVDMSFAGGPPGSDFTVESSEAGRDALLLDASAKLLITDNVDFGLTYNGWFSREYSSNALAARLGVKF